MSRRLILFAKRPRLGRVKTRLTPPLTPQQALMLYRALLWDQVRFVASFASPSCDVELCFDETVADEELPSEAEGLARSEQGPGDLGRRMAAAIERSSAAGRRCTAIVGADAPTLPARYVDAAWRALDAADAVVVPAEDGGYVLLACSDHRPQLFADVPWGGPQVLAVTRRRAADAGLRLVELAPWYDVDDEAGLRRLWSDLQRGLPAADRAGYAHRCLQGPLRSVVGPLDSAGPTVV